MSVNCLAECVRLHRIARTYTDRIRQLERAIVDQQQQESAATREWNRLLEHQKELADWLVETATNDLGMVVSPQIDAGLAGELFIPCSFHRLVNGRCYELELVSTEYEIRMVRGDG